MPNPQRTKRAGPDHANRPTRESVCSIASPYTPVGFFLRGYIFVQSDYHGDLLDGFVETPSGDPGMLWELYRHDPNDTELFYVKCQAWDADAFMRRVKRVDGEGAFGDPDSLWRLVKSPLGLPHVNLCDPNSPDHMLYMQHNPSGKYYAFFGIPPVGANPPQDLLISEVHPARVDSRTAPH
jgi:hypothetical protein